MDFNIPKDIADYLGELDGFIEREIKPLENRDDNIRFFDHRREDARTDWDRGGLPNEEWEALLREARRARRQGRPLPLSAAEAVRRQGRQQSRRWRSSASTSRPRGSACTTTCRPSTRSSPTTSACC